MKTIYLFLFTSLAFGVLHSQTRNRIEISGEIITDSLSREAITVYNLTSNKGTTTDKDGKFVIDVFLNDILKVSALQFQEVNIPIDEDIIRNKRMTIVLVEEVNQLNEVFIFSNDLTGILSGDIDHTTVLRPNYDALYFGIENKEDFVFAEDFTTKVTNLADYETEFRNGVDFVGLAGLIKNSIFKPKRKSTTSETSNFKRITDAYSNDYLTQRLNMSIRDLTAFLIYIEENDFDMTLLDKENEFRFLEFMINQKEVYLRAKNVQD